MLLIRNDIEVHASQTWQYLNRPNNQSEKQNEILELEFEFIVKIDTMKMENIWWW